MQHFSAGLLLVILFVFGGLCVVAGDLSFLGLWFVAILASTDLVVRFILK